MEIFSRFADFKAYKSNKETKEAIKFIMENIARLSEATGVPQWDIRSKLRNDFHIDI